MKNTTTILLISLIVLGVAGYFGVKYGLFENAIFGEKGNVLIGNRYNSQGTTGAGSGKGVSYSGNPSYNNCPYGDGLGWNLALFGKTIKFKSYSTSSGSGTLTSDSSSKNRCWAGLDITIDSITKQYCIYERGTPGCTCPATYENKLSSDKTYECIVPKDQKITGGACKITKSDTTDEHECSKYSYGAYSCVHYESDKKNCPGARAYTCDICSCTNIQEHESYLIKYNNVFNNVVLNVPLDANINLVLSDFTRAISSYNNDGAQCFYLDLNVTGGMNITTNDQGYLFKDQNYSINLIIDNPLPAGEYTISTIEKIQTFFNIGGEIEFVQKVNLTTGRNYIKSPQLLTSGLGAIQTETTIGLVLPGSKETIKTEYEYINTPYNVTLKNGTVVQRFKREKKTIQSVYWTNTIPLGRMSKIYTIADLPLYIEKPVEGCPDGYIDSPSDSEICIRADIKDVSCSITGCPVLNISNQQVGYICSSAGLCVQQVSEQTDCKSDASCGTGKKCDVTSGLCVLEQTYTYLFDCTATTDCLNPCQGKTVACENNKCVYNGTCDLTNLNCMTTKCADGNKCNEITGLCEKESIFDIAKESIWTYIIIAIIVLGAIIIIIYLINK